MARKVSKAGTRRSVYQNKRRKGMLAIVLPWFKRFGFVVVVLFASIWLGAWFFLSDADTYAADWVKNKTLMATAALGFEVDNILVEGRVYSDPAILKAIINVRKGDPLFSFDPAAAQKSIEQIAWVDTVHVERRWPDTIYMKIKERKPLALWQQDKKLKLIGQKGEVIAAADITPFRDFVIILGDNAPEQAPALLQLLHAEPIIFDRIESVGLIVNRRWDVILKNDIRIKLPEDDIGLALSRLAKAQEEDGILDKEITSIDLREPERMIVRTKPGAVSEYQSNISKASTSGGNNI